MSMSFLYDKQIRRYCFFMAGMILLLFLFGWGFIVIQTNTVQTAFLEHENAIVTSLLNQGVSKEIVAEAVSSTQTSDAGSDFLASVGRTTQTSSSLFPFTAAFERTTGEILLAAGLFFSLLLLSGTYLFLQGRECLYRQAIDTVQRFIEGDYTRRMPWMGEGAIYQLCISVDRLATMLQYRNETEHRTK